MKKVERDSQEIHEEILHEKENIFNHVKQSNTKQTKREKGRSAFTILVLTASNFIFISSRYSFKAP